MSENFTIPHTEIVDFNPFAGPEISHTAPSTEPQMEVWTACQLGGDNATRAYNLSISILFKGAFNKLAMEQAIQALINRHDALRAVFSTNGEHLFIAKELVIDVAYHNLQEKTTGEKELVLADYVNQDALHVFNLLEGPLFKAGLFKFSDQDHRLVLTTHHSVSDGWSTGIILQDLSTYYSAYAQGIALNLPDAPSFTQYANEQLQYLNSDDYYQIEKFWVNKYKNNVPILDLPTDFLRPAFRTFDSKRLDYPLDDDLVAAVKKMGLKAGCSFVTTLLAAFEVLVHRLSGQEDIVVGLPTAGQSVTGNERLVGHCVNLLPLRSHLQTNSSFTDFLKAGRQSVFDAYEHQRLTFSSLLRKLNIPRDASRLPLVPVVFNVDMGMNDGVNFFGLTHQLITHPKQYENFEWFFNISEFEKKLTVEWSYNTKLFKSETIDQMMMEFENILITVVANPAVLIGDIKFKSEHSLSEKLIQWNNTSSDYPHQPIHELIDQTAIKYPTRTAVIFDKQEVSYQELNETASQLANHLIQKGINTGDIVGISLDRSPEMLITLLAILKAGAAYLPLDPEYPNDRLTFMLTDSSARMLITSKKYSGHLKSQATEILIEDALTEAKAYVGKKPSVSVSVNDLAYVLYTSGSTGKPKGVLIEHRNLVNFLWSMQEVPGITSNDVLLAVTTISFDIAGLELYLPLLAGATIVLADAASAQDGRAILDLVNSKNVSVMQATPSTWRMMLDSGWDKPLPLKVLCGGEALPKELAEKLLLKCTELWNVYGPTETTIWSTVKKINTGELITIGRPINNTQLYILDEFLKPTAEGIVGELYIAGDGVARGYLNRQELTSERFIHNPFDNLKQSLMYRTGDLGKFLENGEIQCLGRVDQQVKIRGYRIELGEIESVLSTISEINEAVVVAREDRPGDQRLVAYVVLKTPTTAASQQADAPNKPTLDVSQIHEWQQQIRTKLPDYMIPNEFVALPNLPLTPNGKIDRKALPEPNRNGGESRVSYMAPRTDIEKLIADIWIECLRIEKISVLDDFFELGGHSLIAVQIMTRLEKETGKRLPLSTLFEHPTIEKLALALQMDGKFITWDSLVPIKPKGTKTPLYIIHGDGLHVMLFNTLAKHMDIEQPLYGLQAMGINGIDEPLGSIEDIAAYYISAIKENNPDGPYALAGYSFGGKIAYEMSRQLINSGKEVKLLALFDTNADPSNYFDPWISRIFDDMQLGIKRFLYTFVLLSKDVRGTISYKKESIKRRINYLYSKLKHKEDYFKVFYGISYKVYESNQLAARNYKLVPLDIEIDLFRADERTGYLEDYDYLGWKPFALKGINVHRVSGDHVSMFNPPNDKEFARTLQKVLNSR